MRRIWVLVAALLVVGLQGVRAAGPGAPERLTEESYATVRKHVELRPGDLRFQEVDWQESFYDGVARAQKEDKPLVLWLYFGDPRSNC